MKGASQHSGKKKKKIILILKPGKHNELTSYRLISLLPIASKVSEKLLQMVENNTLISNHQFGFRQRDSTIEQTHRIVQRINEALENKLYCSAAFYTSLKHSAKYGILDFCTSLRRSLPLNYFIIQTSYLHSRHFLVKVETEYTELCTPSVLGPLLYHSNLCRRYCSSNH
jgi:hypothetical protein